MECSDISDIFQIKQINTPPSTLPQLLRETQRQRETKTEGQIELTVDLRMQLWVLHTQIQFTMAKSIVFSECGDAGLSSQVHRKVGLGDLLSMETSISKEK